MGKGHGLTFTIFAALGAIAGYATYMANKDEFSEDTKESYGRVVNRIKNVGTDIKRTYTSIGDKEAFKDSASNLGESAKKLAEKTGVLVKNASKDMFSNVKNKITKAANNFIDDDYDESYDDLDVNYAKKKKTTTKAKPSKKTNKKKNKK